MRRPERYEGAGDGSEEKDGKTGKPLGFDHDAHNLPDAYEGNALARHTLTIFGLWEFES